MISIHAEGYLSEKPVQQVFANSTKVEFDVVSRRLTKENGQWKELYERATFYAWNEEADRVVNLLDKGSSVHCVGFQETDSWTDNDGRQHRRVKYRLTGWMKVPSQQPRPGSGEQSQEHSGRSHNAGAPAQGRSYQRQQQPAPKGQQGQQPYRGTRQQTPPEPPHDDRPPYGSSAPPSGGYESHPGEMIDM